LEIGPARIRKVKVPDKPPVCCDWPELLKLIAAQVNQRNQVYRDWGFDRKMNRGFGISALFAGESGTGKTMAAEVIANALRLNLYRSDLSQVVNQYIGETEKNLRRLFDAAEDGGAILFFDEADALFGKRSEVKDSHDRYANIEINYLLQRMESYRGLAILATNQKSALDQAFIRRLRFIVNFYFPAAADRLRLWQKAFMQHEAGKGLPLPPLGQIDYSRLAALNLTGGHIHNVALNAAFLAAHRSTATAPAIITMPIILEAARAEFRKMDRPINETEFKWTEPAPPAPAEAAKKTTAVPA
jgi:SpoVK/Ycf46/Vps4 family AAA+-type ATPase